MQLVSRGGAAQRSHTLDSIKQAYRICEAVEVGVRSTVEGVLVLADDDMMDDCIIRKCSLAQLREKRSDVATLEDVLELHRVHRGEKELILDLQGREVWEPLAALLGGGGGLDRVLLVSVDYDMIDVLRQRLPSIRMLYLLEQGDNIKLAVRRAKRTGVAGLHLDVRLLPQVRPEWTPLCPVWASWCPPDHSTPQLLRHVRTNYPWLQRYSTDLQQLSE